MLFNVCRHLVWNLKRWISCCVLGLLSNVWMLEFVIQVFVTQSMIILLFHGRDYCSMAKTAVNGPQTPCPSHMFSVSCRTSAPRWNSALGWEGCMDRWRRTSTWIQESQATKRTGAQRRQNRAFSANPAKNSDPMPRRHVIASWLLPCNRVPIILARTPPP